VDTCFAWGKSEYELIQSKYSSYQHKLVVTGSPRIDLLHQKNRALFSEDVGRIHRHFGNYFLFVSNFTVNHPLGVDGKFALLKRLGRYNSDTERRYYEKSELAQAGRFEKWVELVKNTAKKFPKQTIIVRPHPSEDRAYWDQLATEFDNVSIQRENSVVPWILGAKVQIHSGCTTGIEAFFLNVPSISFLPPGYSEGTEGHVANDASCVCASQGEVFQAITRLTAPGEDTQKLCRNLSRVRHHIENFHRPDGVVKIVSRLKKFSTPDANISFLARLSIVARIHRGIIFGKCREMVSRESKTDSFLKRQRYGLQKYDDFSFNKIKEFVRVICENHPTPNQQIRVRYLGKDIVYLTR